MKKLRDAKYWMNWCRQLLRVCQLLINKNKSLSNEIKKYKPERTIN